MRYYALLVAVFASSVTFGLVLGAERIPFAYPLIGLGLLTAGSAAVFAVMPVSTASRHQRRALANLRTNPEFALLDLTRAIEMDPNDRSLLVDPGRRVSPAWAGTAKRPPTYRRTCDTPRRAAGAR